MMLSVTIVLYHNDAKEIQQTIQCLLSAQIDLKLFLIDNSETDELRILAQDDRVAYIFNNKNLGYGAAHNIGIEKALMGGSRYHLILNPDIAFNSGTLEHLFEYMEVNTDVGSLMPKVFYEDGTLQRLCKLLPTPFDLIGRRFFSGMEWAKQWNERYELHQFAYDAILNTPCLSGCFMFVRTEAFNKAGVFDPRYFMYLEDYDLNRRIHKHYKTIFYPEVAIVHGHAKESYKNGKLLKIHMMSAIKYFNKWGWFYDAERSLLNREILQKINNHTL